MRMLALAVLAFHAAPGARPDGSHHTVRVLHPARGVAMFMRVNTHLERVAPIR